MKVDAMGLSSLGPPERGELRGARERGGERFSIDGVSQAEGPNRDDPHPFASDRVGGRRRGPARINRRVDGTHAAKEHQSEETRAAERGDFHFDLDATDPDEGRGGEEEAAADERAAAAADFEALSSHLLRLGGPIREVTLYLPSLGTVTARLEAGAISIFMSVPRRLVAAVRRGERELRQQMDALGLRIAQVQVRERDELREEGSRPAAPRSWPQSGLVDVMA